MARTRIIQSPPLAITLGGSLPDPVWGHWFRIVSLYLQQILPAADDDCIVWDRLVVDLLSARPGGTNDPTLTVFQGGTYAWAFSGTAVNELFFSAVLPHCYKAGTDLYPFVKWAANGTGTAAITWGIETTIVAPGSAFPATSTDTATVTPSGTDRALQLAEFTAIDGADLEEGSVIVGRVYRDGASDASTDTAFGLAVGFHYAVEKLGTRERDPTL